ncbi:MAG TPA: substrate-binding domain-containing protein [Bacillota bacterium]|nr:substrate-binding domain-containing protein [Bacillota bacterium]
MDAIIAANDYMAIGAINELQNRGYRVPEDIAVVGFDNIYEAQNFKIPLTTAQQPLLQIGKIAVEKIISLFEGAPVETTTLPTEIIIRKSCGCNHINKSYHPILFNTPVSTDYSLIQKIAFELEAKYPEVNDKLKESWALELVNCFANDLRTENYSFLDLLTSYIETSYKKGLSIVVWLSVLRELANMANNFDSDLITPLIANAFTIVGEFLNKVNVYHESQAEDFFNITQRLYHIFNRRKIYNNHRLEQRINIEFDRLGIQSFYLSRFKEDDSQKAKLSYYYSKNQHVLLEKIDDYFETQDLIPGHFQNAHERYSFVVLPIAQTGFVMFEANKFDETINAHQNVTTYKAVKTIVLINEIRHYTSQLEYLVEERTRLLKEAEEAQQRLVETAHKAGMAEIAIGIMHNIGNLINSINISTEEIVAILNKSKLPGLLKANQLFKNYQPELSNLFNSQSKLLLLPDYYDQIGNILKDEQEKISAEIEQLINKVTLIQGIIQTLQEYASNDYYNDFEEEVELSAVIENSLKIQESNILKHNIKVIKEFNVPLFFVTNQTKLTHIMVNLIKNAIEAMCNTENEPTLSIRLYLNTQLVPVIEVSDNGEGIAKEDLKKMFTYGFTTKENGHGFGLHTCANYMNEMGGSITVHSNGKGKGATFTLILNNKKLNK